MIVEGSAVGTVGSIVESTVDGTAVSSAIDKHVRLTTGLLSS